MAKKEKVFTEINYVKATLDLSVKEIIERMDDGTMAFDNIAQRGSVWETARKSLLIRSILLKYPIDSILARNIEKDEMTILDDLDGQQRCRSVREFVKGDFALDLGDFSGNIKIGKDVCDIEGKCFSELPASFQDKILSFMFRVDYYSNLPDEVANEMFYFKNNGKPMASDQHMWAMVKAKAQFEEIGRGNELFTKILSENGQKKYEYRTYLLQAHRVLHYEVGKGLEKKALMSVYIDRTVTKAEVEELRKICELYSRIFDLIDVRCTANKTVKNQIKGALKKKTHFVSLCPVLRVAIKDKRTVEELADWIIKIFGDKKGVLVSLAYKSASATSVLKASSVEKRMSELANSYVNYFPVKTKGKATCTPVVEEVMNDEADGFNAVEGESECEEMTVDEINNSVSEDDEVYEVNGTNASEEIVPVTNEDIQPKQMSFTEELIADMETSELANEEDDGVDEVNEVSTKYEEVTENAEQ